MNATLVLTFLRQRAGSVMRLVFIGVLALFTVGACAVTRAIDPLNGLAGVLALILGAGAIGQDVSSGVLQLTLSRPITRAEYVLSRWLASALGAAVLLAAIYAAGIAVVIARGGSVELVAGSIQFGQSVLSAVAVSAVILALSSLAPGLGDIALWFLGLVSASIAQNAGAFTNRPWLAVAGRELEHTLSPAFGLGWLHGDPISWASLATYVSTVTLALAVAVVVTNRRELSYANG